MRRLSGFVDSDPEVSGYSNAISRGACDVLVLGYNFIEDRPRAEDNSQEMGRILFRHSRAHK
jgi:hypothetical protein